MIWLCMINVKNYAHCQSGISVHKIFTLLLLAKSITAAIYCDNKAAVKRTKTIMNKYKYPYSIKTANHNK